MWVRVPPGSMVLHFVKHAQLGLFNPVTVPFLDKTKKGVQFRSISCINQMLCSSVSSTSVLSIVDAVIPIFSHVCALTNNGPALM